MLQIDLAPGENVIKIVRRHWIAIIGHVVSLFVLIFVPIIGYAVLQSFYLSFPWATVTPLLTFIYAVWLLFAWNALFYFFTNSYLDVWIITNLRIFTLDQKQLFSREVSSFTLDKIHELTIDVYGILATFLKFGRIEIETAAENKVFSFKRAKDPEHIKQIINDAQNNYQSFIN